MSTEIRYRKMVAADAVAVENVEKQCFKMPWSRQAFWEEAAKSDAYYIVAEAKVESGWHLVAYIGIWLIFNEGHITNVAVEPEYRDHGIGTMLLQKIIEVAKTRGVEAITLEVRPSNVPALKLYDKYGFKSAGRRPHYYLDNGEDAEIMWLTFADLAKGGITTAAIDKTLDQLKTEVDEQQDRQQKQIKQEDAAGGHAEAGHYI